MTKTYIEITTNILSSMAGDSAPSKSARLNSTTSNIATLKATTFE